MARNTAVRAMAELAGKSATLVLTVVAVHVLGPKGFGAFAFAFAFSLLIATVPAGGLSDLLVKRASDTPAALDRLLTQTLVLNFMLAVPAYLLVGGAVAATRSDAQGETAVVLLLLASLFEVWNESLRAASVALQRQAGVSLALVVQRLATTGVACAALVGGAGVVGLSAAYLAGTALGTCAVLVAVRRLGVRFTREGLRLQALVETIGLSLPIGADQVVAMALFRLDAVLLGLLAGDRAVGLYAASYRYLETVLFMTWTVNQAVFPAVAAKPEPWRVRRGVEQGFGVLALVYLPFAAMLLLRPQGLLGLLYPAEFVDPGTPVLRWLAAAPLAFALGYLASYGLLARGRTGRVLTASAAAAALNLVANLVLVPRLQATGAAVTTTVSYLAEALLLVLWLRTEVCLRWAGLVRPLRASALAMLPLVGVLLLPIPVVPAVLAGTALYGCVWLLAASRWSPESVAVLRSLALRSR